MILNVPTKSAGDFALPVLGVGTWRMGGGLERDPGNDDSRDIAAIRAALLMGVRHIDTAERYAAGHAEELTREAIRGFDRAQLYLVSKVYSTNLKYDDVLTAARGTLARLDTDYLDLYLIHGPSQNGVPIAETMRAMDTLIDQGLTRFIGVSNFTWPQIEEALRQARHKIVCNQINYSLAARAYEQNGTLEYCRRNDILVCAYRPIARGDFGAAGNAILENLAKKYKRPSMAVALAWVLAKPNIVAIVKAANLEHLKDDLEAVNLSLTAEDVKYLDENFPAGETMGIGRQPAARH